MKHKVGDVVKVKAINWYKNNANIFGQVEIENYVFVKEMSKYCGQFVVIKSIEKSEYCSAGVCYKIENDHWFWYDEFFVDVKEERKMKLNKIYDKRF